MPKKTLSKSQSITSQSKIKKVKAVVRKKETPLKKKAPLPKKIVEIEKKPRVETKRPTVRESKKQEWVLAIGKRKTAVAQVRYLPTDSGEIKVNNKPLSNYFPWFEFQQIASAPLKLINQANKGTVLIRVRGGGQRAQAEAIRLGISRALQIYRPEWRPILKSAGLLTRDARIKERKKPGLKRARRAPQWSKR